MNQGNQFQRRTRTVESGKECSRESPAGNEKLGGPADVVQIRARGREGPGEPGRSGTLRLALQLRTGGMPSIRNRGFSLLGGMPSQIGGDVAQANGHLKFT
ncbi:hypothetical protein MCOR02_004958 [Pyricularia oryzae]|nr:hypothetical protein MCOR02_004958 [Pyricularia oryzae]